MTRPWLIVLVLGASLLAGLAAVGWISTEILRLDRNEREARGRAALEENIRLSLWRMDSFLAPLIAQESVRPYFQYTAFFPAERAYTKMFAEIEANDVIIPSPLLTFESPYVRLHFQVGPDNTFTSPQTPTGNMRDRAEVDSYRSNERIHASQELLSELQKKVPIAQLCQSLPLLPARPANVLESYSNSASVPQNPRFSPLAQSSLNRQEQASRNQFASNSINWNSDAPFQAVIATSVNETVLRPVWVGDALLLARRVHANGQDYIQGCWLDWEKIRPQMLESIRDLLPSAALVPRPEPHEGDETRRLASLPVYLLPGNVPLADADLPSPVSRSLALAWVAALMASLLAAIVLWQTMSLSERRGAFVSAVTHELRTPLTTFRLYTDLLTQHPDAPAQKRNEYLITMRREAERLAHLVENVLAFARLERKSVAARMEERNLAKLVAESRERLSERAAQAGLTLDVIAPESTADLLVRVDPGAFEQILFNLVDNASKYASTGSEPLLHVELAREGARAVVRVRDHGPGISEDDARKLFRPFSKSAQQAAVSAPGVGLGLALSRRLARQLGGELTLEPHHPPGATFKLELPAC